MGMSDKVSVNFMVQEEQWFCRDRFWTWLKCHLQIRFSDHEWIRFQGSSWCGDWHRGVQVCPHQTLQVSLKRNCTWHDKHLFEGSRHNPTQQLKDGRDDFSHFYVECSGTMGKTPGKRKTLWEDTLLQSTMPMSMTGQKKRLHLVFYIMFQFIFY